MPKQYCICLQCQNTFIGLNTAFVTLQVFTEIQTCMKGFPAKARVVYVPVLEVGSEGRLARACSILLDFDEVIFIKYCYSFGFFRKWSLY